MQSQRDLVSAFIFGAIIVALAVFAVIQRPAAVPPAARTQAQAALTIPTIDDMCKALGAVDKDSLKVCQDNEQAAGEFVIAWMGFNNFIVDGAISLDQIQLLASLDDNSGLGSDSLALDPNLDASLAGDSGSQTTSGIDPITGEPLGTLQSPAQLALFCLQMATDWVSLHDCISENDPSSTVGGVQ